MVNSAMGKLKILVVKVNTKIGIELGFRATVPTWKYDYHKKLDYSFISGFIDFFHAKTAPLPQNYKSRNKIPFMDAKFNKGQDQIVRCIEYRTSGVANLNDFNDIKEKMNQMNDASRHIGRDYQIIFEDEIDCSIQDIVRW